MQEAAPGRPNVIGVLDGKAPGKSLMFCGHIDTVGVEGMDAPFTPTVRDGRLYGRGSQDMKGGVAAMIDAARVDRRAGTAEGASDHRRSRRRRVREHRRRCARDTVAADGAVVTEPTDLQIGIGHKGFAWLEVETRGRAAHGSRPKDGRDAILRMGRILHRLDSLDRQLQARAPHPVMGTGSLHASIITGGRELSSYPDRCRLQMERRTIVGERDGQPLEEVQAILAGLVAEDAEFDGAVRLAFSRPPYEIAADHPLPTMLASVARPSGISPSQVGMSFWTDAAVLAASGIPSVLFGPGGAGLHSREEYVNVADVLTCRDVLAALAVAWG